MGQVDAGDTPSGCPPPPGCLCHPQNAPHILLSMADLQAETIGRSLVATTVRTTLRVGRSRSGKAASVSRTLPDPRPSLSVEIHSTLPATPAASNRLSRCLNRK